MYWKQNHAPFTIWGKKAVLSKKCVFSKLQLMLQHQLLTGVFAGDSSMRTTSAFAGKSCWGHYPSRGSVFLQKITHKKLFLISGARKTSIFRNMSISSFLITKMVQFIFLFPFLPWLPGSSGPNLMNNHSNYNGLCG